jgi:hypothetical protein
MGGASSSGFFVQQGERQAGLLQSLPRLATSMRCSMRRAMPHARKPTSALLAALPAAGAGEAGGPAGVFSGTTTTANNGGFASVRTRNAEPPLDLGAYEGLELRLKGDGQRYKLILRCSPGWDTVGYTASFPTQPGWQTVRLPFRDLAPVFRARTQRGMAPFNPASVYSVQLMLSKFESDGALNPTFREGAFELPVERISAYLAEPVVPRFVLVSSAGVTRPNRPGINVEEEPPAVRMNDMLGGILTYKVRAGGRAVSTPGCTPGAADTTVMCCAPLRPA